jgi:hypothetical protein
MLLSVGTQLRVLDDRAKVERFIEWNVFSNPSKIKLKLFIHSYYIILE